MAESECREEEYSQLKDLRISLDGGRVEGERDGKSCGFSLCFWIYLSGSARPSSLILTQVNLQSEDQIPFLALSRENKLTLFPLMFLHHEAPPAGNSFPWTDMPHVSAEIECSLEKWVHVGCEVATNYMRLHIDGKLVGENPLSFSSNGQHFLDNLERIRLVGNDGKLEGYVYHVQVLRLSASITDQYLKNPPVKLSLDMSCVSDGVEEGDDGVWSIVGGKASCRRNFSLDVVLLDAFGRSVHKEMEIVASLFYADNGTPVGKTKDDAEAPLLISSDGLEYPSTDRPVTLLRGRATFKLKISQLSSKSDNRLFHVFFHTTLDQRYPFLEAYSHPIRCISRNRTTRAFGLGKRLTSTTVLLDELHSPRSCDGSRVVRENHGNGQIHMSSRSALTYSPPLKRYKVDGDRSTTIDANRISEQDEKTFKTSLEVKSNNIEGTDSAPSDTESTDARNSESRWTGEATYPITDAIIFKYCLEGTYERLMLLKEILASASDDDLTNFAEQVCLYSGCSHHWHQILISKKLVLEGADTWNLISHNNHRVLWTDAVPEIEKKFRRIANSDSRGFSEQDLEVLRGIARCGDDLGREDFDRLWNWLYPVALALSKDGIKKMWECMSPKWIEGFITAEEAENALIGPRGLEKPGTFVLRFATSRSWPHPDAGSLVVAFVGTDSRLHHKLLSLDQREKDSRQLHDLLLEEPELSQLGRVTRLGNTTC